MKYLNVIYQQDLGENIEFAPIGLIDMYNSGGAIEDVMYSSDDLPDRAVNVKTRGCGQFGAYSSTKPSSCKVDMNDNDFTYNKEKGLLVINLKGDCHTRDIKVVY